MKIKIENTSKTVELITENGRVPARLWEGKTDSGIPVICYVTRIAVRDDAGYSAHDQFRRELEECRKPSAEVEAIPLRLIL